MKNHSEMFIEPLDCHIHGWLTASAIDLKVGSGKNLVFSRDVVLHKVVDPFVVEPVVHQHQAPGIHILRCFFMG